MKKAFTMIELVFVIVVIGILAAVIIPNMRTNPLQEAAIQLLSHIRYTQHLALIDDKFDSNDANWYKKRWQIVFVQANFSNNVPAYTIYADTAGKSTGDPNISEIALNPENTSQLMTGGSTGGEVILNINDANFPGMKKLNLGMSYGITDVDFSLACSIAKSSRLAFDHLGRPIKGKLGLAAGRGNVQAYEGNNLIQARCNITLTSPDGAIVIAIEPETGYSCILDSNANCI